MNHLLKHKELSKEQRQSILKQIRDKAYDFTKHQAVTRSLVNTACNLGPVNGVYYLLDELGIKVSYDDIIIDT